MQALKILVAAAAWALAAGNATAQQVEKNVGIVAEDVASQMQAFSYREGPKSHLLFRSTAIGLAADGDGRVEFQDGRSTVEVNVRKLPSPATLGPYTTYVLWAITIDGRASNLGSIELADGRGSLRASTPLAQFALIVTAEPHFAVTTPSRHVVLRNLARNVKGQATTISGLAERMDYASLKPVTTDPRKKIPPDLVQARYALQIADLAQAKQYASGTYERAAALLAAAETAQASRRYSERKEAPRLAREAVQVAEDARRDAIEEKVADEEQARRDAAALAARQAAEEKARIEAEAAREVAAREAAIALEAARMREEQAAREAAARARAEFTARLNRALPTRETDRGIVAELAGVLFATGAATLDPGAREALARFSGIVVTYPELRFKIEGHTDSTGSYETNRSLSLQRAIAVRDYLISQGIAASTVDVEGLGPDQPVADNDTPAGRAANRRVEIVLTGGPAGSGF
jgi:outer membrane protein OmpA-like peptidoglycan-associated protein